MATRSNLFRQLHACIELDSGPAEFIPGKPKRLPEKDMGPAVVVERHPNAKKLTNKKKDPK